jgi:hypothetical protein
MSTNARIGFVDPKTNLIHSIHLHWDGYISKGAGQCLRDHYTNLKKIRRLIALGSLSVLEQHVSPLTAPKPWVNRYWHAGIINDGRQQFVTKHTYETPVAGVTVAYHRDQDVEWETVKPDVEPEMTNTEEYNYLYKAGQWYVKCYKTDWVKIPDGDLTKIWVS